MAIPIFPDDLIMEILSWLPVICLLRFKCVSKSFYSIITDPIFVKLHLQRSPKTVNFLVEYKPEYITHDLQYPIAHDLQYPIVLPCPKSSLLDDSLSQIIKNENRHIDHKYHPYEFILGACNDHKYHPYEFILGSCNGLVCFSATIKMPLFSFTIQQERTFLLWNPATKQMFSYPKIVKLTDFEALGFGYDNVSDTYKVVVIFFFPASKDGSRSAPNEVKVCNTSENNCWRNIQSFPAYTTPTIMKMRNVGVYLKNTLNWIALARPYDPDGVYWSKISLDEIVIVSLDLGNETYTQFSLPSTYSEKHITDFNSIGYSRFKSKWDEILTVLKDCLSLFLHNFRNDTFAIWQMKEFGNDKSWNPLLTIFPCWDLKIQYFPPRFYLQPLCVFEDGTILIIFHRFDDQLIAMLYDGRDRTVKRSELPRGTVGFYTHVQSLVCPGKY